VGRVLVVTDSSATVPEHLAQELDIRVVPVVLAMNGRVYRDGVDVSPGELYRWLRAEKLVPTTSAPSVGHFLQVYLAAAQEASGILSIHMSPKLSSTYDAAVTASQLIDSVPIHVMDSHTVAMAQGFVVLTAAREAAAGADLEAVQARAEAVAAKVNLLACLDTLQYLHRGGRIGGAAAFAGALLQIKPVLSVIDGHVGLFSKPRTRSRAIRTMVQRMDEVAAGRPICAAIFHADVPDEAESLRRLVAGRFDCAELHVVEFTPVMGAHTGPGVLGVAFHQASDVT
jgi:DegV family protein with EDD domain